MKTNGGFDWDESIPPECQSRLYPAAATVFSYLVVTHEKHVSSIEHPFLYLAAARYTVEVILLPGF